MPWSAPHQQRWGEGGRMGSWNDMNPKRLGGRTRFFQRQTTIKEQRRALVRNLLSQGIQEWRALQAWLKANYPSLPRSHSTIERDVKAVRCEWAIQNRCPTCGRGPWRHEDGALPLSSGLPMEQGNGGVQGQDRADPLLAGVVGLESDVVPRRGSGRGMVHASESHPQHGNRNNTERVRA